MEGFATTIALLLVVLGFLAIFAGPSAEVKRLAQQEVTHTRGVSAKKKSKSKQKTKSKVKQ
eukprot:scaffold534258_cov34-Prasinocladus_malaysianus.AAC.1